MSSLTTSWEPKLLAWAYEAVGSDTSAETATAEIATCVHTPLLERAYRYCEALTKDHSRTFYLASSLLPKAKRRAVRALYAYCRFSDDLVDCAVSDPQAALNAWRRSALAPCPPSDDLVALAWADTRVRYGIPRRYAEQLIEGVARDLTQTRYATFDDLAAYS